MKSIMLLLVLVATSLTAQANNLKQIAITEATTLKNKAIVKETATDATVGGMLKLEDPRPQVLGRSWNYFAAIKVGNHTPVGQVQSDTIGQVDINGAGSTVMPSLELGFVQPVYSNQWKVGVGALASGGLASQKMEIALPSGYLVEDARLNSTLVTAGLSLHLSNESLKWLEAYLSTRLGKMTYTQSNPEGIGNFSRSADVRLINAGLLFKIRSQFALVAEYSQREVLDSTQQSFSVEENNYEIGTRFTW